MNDLGHYMSLLARSRPAFHSEADFQHSLAWLIHEQESSLSIRLEYPDDIQNEHRQSRFYVDVFIFDNNEKYAIELKYKTKELSANINGEEFRLKGQSAQNHGRYDYLKDVERLEHLKSIGMIAKGYSVLLTNDHLYWVRPAKDNFSDKAFRIHDGKVMENAILSWGASASDGTTKGRRQPIEISGTYTLLWRDYSLVNESTFRYLWMQV